MPSGDAPGLLSEQVAARLQAHVLDNGLHAGDRLPSERELCELLGVSRTVVREAVRLLVAKGLLDVRRGGGTVVRPPDVKAASDAMTIMLRDSERIPFTLVHEVRRLLEVEIAGLAAERRTAEDLVVLDAHLSAGLEHADDPERWAQADVAFHAALAAGAHNPLFPLLLGTMAEILTELRLTAARLAGTPERAHAFHRAIFVAVEGCDRAAARRSMSEHMVEAEATFQKARAGTFLGDRGSPKSSYHFAG
jgi:GntR family transcriptional regulator, transcriptional repressor for pyruvate dehydrogenase complex